MRAPFPTKMPPGNTSLYFEGKEVSQSWDAAVGQQTRMTLTLLSLRLLLNRAMASRAGVCVPVEVNHDDSIRVVHLR